MQIKIRKGLTVPIKGSPDESVIEEVATSEVAVLGGDIMGLRPSMIVAEGDAVKVGDTLFEDKKNPGVIITAPASGTIKAINRGHRRVLESVVIQTSGQTDQKIAALGSNVSANKLSEALVATGLWPSFRTRPYGKVPALNSRPAAIFVNTMDTNPLAMNPMVAVNAHQQEFAEGVNALSALADGAVYVAKAHETALNTSDLKQDKGIEVVEFSGPHPAGLSGTHIHFVYPCAVGREVWSIEAQEVITIGKLVLTGEVWSKRYIGIGGEVAKPRVVIAPCGARIGDILGDDVRNGLAIAGSPLSGHKAEGPFNYLGRFDRQISVISRPKERELFGWIRQGKNKFSASNVFFNAMNRKRPIEMTTSANGSPRAMMPTGIFEDLMPLDILPTQLLRAAVVGDTDTVQKLGGLELIEEDLALLTFSCPGKYDYGVALRYCLDKIEKEG